MSCPLQKPQRPDRTEPAEALHLCALGRLGAPDWHPHPGSACSWLLKGPWMPRLPRLQGPSSVQSKVSGGTGLSATLVGSSRPGLTAWEAPGPSPIGRDGAGSWGPRAVVRAEGVWGGRRRPVARTLTEPRQQAQQRVLVPLLGDVQHVVQPHLAGHALLLQEPAPQRRQPPSSPRARALSRHTRSRTW